MKLAKDSSSENVSKSNWISIIQYLVEKKDFSRIMKLVVNIKVLRLEDVLPYFPDFSDMDTFKVNRSAIFHVVQKIRHLPSNSLILILLQFFFSG
jgi:hypothetical protein